jgi:uncharacterized membrane protein
MWEGYDEWAHFAYIQQIAKRGQLPARSGNVPDEIQRSLELAPLSHSAAEVVPSGVTHDAYWRLPESDRLRREVELRQLTPAYKLADASEKRVTQYEAQQPPLYYLLLTIPYLAVKHWSLPAQVLTLRVISLMIAGIALLLGYAIARQVAVTRSVAIWVAIMLASFSGVLIDVCRVGNDSLAITLSSAVILCSLRILKRDSGFVDWVVLGAVLAAALLTKAYTLAFVPLLLVLAAIQVARRRGSAREIVLGSFTAFLIAASTAGWWYWRSWAATGTLSGEQIDAAAKQFGFGGKLHAITNVQWLRVLDSAAMSHIWTGGWSFLVVRSWMYRVFELLAVAAAIGLAILAARMLVKMARRRTVGDTSARLAVVASAYLLACLGLAYYALVVFLVKGVSLALGWYLYSVIAAEIVLLASGFTGLVGLRRSASCLAAITLIALAFDLYTVHFVLTPYYTGLIHHGPSGSLMAFHVTDLRGIGFPEIGARLTLNESSIINPAALTLVWIGYLCATAGLLAYSVNWIVGVIRSGARNPSVSERIARIPRKGLDAPAVK